MRYSNGFTIGWKDGANARPSKSDSADQEMLALRGAQ
jgi:hypothetical protein